MVSRRSAPDGDHHDRAAAADLAAVDGAALAPEPAPPPPPRAPLPAGTVRRFCRGRWTLMPARH